MVEAIKDQANAPCMHRSLQKLYLKGFRPKIAIDIGAFQGAWSESVRSIFPETDLLLIEPLPDKQDHLKQLARSLRADLACCLLSDQSASDQVFYVGSCGSSMHKPKRFKADNVIQIATKKLDDLVTDSNFARPDLVKIDVQGAEDRVIRGGEKTLHSAEVLIIELSLINSYSEGLLFHEMIGFLAERDFLLYDIAGLLRANRTKSVNEVDGVFVRRDSSLWDIHYFLPSDAPLS